jgi:hypothetical protein
MSTSILVGLCGLIFVAFFIFRKQSNAKTGETDTEKLAEKTVKTTETQQEVVSIETRIKLPTGEEGTVRAIGDNGYCSIAMDLKPGDDPERLKFAGDPDKSLLVWALLRTPPDERDEQWHKKFLDNVADANFRCDSEQPIDGPDGFPYLSLSSPETGKPFQVFVIRHIVPNLLNNGCGVVINVGKGNPDAVFTYGDIVNYYLHGAFDAVDDRFEVYDDDAPNEEKFGDQKIQVSDPSEQILPPPLRLFLRRFLHAYRLPPKVMLMNRAPNPEAGRKGGLSLVFPFTPEANKDAEVSQYVCRALPWFLPRHYSVIWMYEGDSFFDL